MQVHLGHGVLWMFFYAWVKFWGEKSQGKSWIIFIIFYHVAILLNYSILRIMVSLDIGSKEFWIFSYFNTLILSIPDQSKNNVRVDFEVLMAILEGWEIWRAVSRFSYSITLAKYQTGLPLKFKLPIPGCSRLF